MMRSFKLFTVGLIAVMLAACAEGAAQYESQKRETQGEVWLEQQRDLVVCRVHNSDLGYKDSFASKVPLYDEYNREHLDCHGLLNQEFFRKGRYSGYGVPGGDTVKLAQNNLAYKDVWTDEVRAVQWMHLHPNVQACTTLIQSSTKQNGLIRNCDGHLVFVKHTVVPTGTPVCGQADIPTCGAASP